MIYNDPHKYDSIIHKPYIKSKQHPWMSQLNRASQFAPFAALTGHKEVMDETQRRVDSKIILDEDALNILNSKIQFLLSSSNTTISVTYFVQDALKEGGKYVTVTGLLTSTNEIHKSITVNQQVILIEDIIDLDSPLFSTMIVDK